MYALAVTTPDLPTLMGPVADGVLDTITGILPIAIPVLVILAGITIALRVMGKFGVRR